MAAKLTVSRGLSSCSARFNVLPCRATTPKLPCVQSIQKRTAITKSMSDPRFFTLVQHARSKMLDEHRKSGILSHKIEVNRVRLNFETTGDGPHVVLFVPGAIGSSRTDFTKQLSDFNKTDFTVIAMDPRGYGKSIPPERDWPLEFLQRDADDAVELLRKLGIDKASVVGWSDGGIVGMIMAARNPKLVDKLVLWGCNAYVTDKDMKVYKDIQDINNWSERMRSPFMALYGQRYFRRIWKEWVDAYEKYLTKRNGDVCKEDMQFIKAKTLIIHGLKDPLVTLEHPDYLHHHIKGSRLYIMPEGKHNLHVRYYREFNFLVEHFLKE